MLMGQMMVGLGEGIELTKAASLDPLIFIEILGLGAMANPMFKGKGPNMVKGAFVSGNNSCCLCNAHRCSQVLRMIRY